MSFSLLLLLKSYSQGCVVARNISGFGQYNLAENSFTTSAWELNINNRYFTSYRDFAGSKNINTPAQNKNEVKSFSTDILVERYLNHGWSVDLDVPISANSRTSNAEHEGPGTPRFTTHAFGLNDIRLTVYKWLMNSVTAQKFNLQIGLGLKLPTGDYRYEDYFHTSDTTTVLAPVNFGIQLGDGGTGIITELNGYYFLSKNLSMYGNLYYLITPREQNGVATTAKAPPPIWVTVSNNVTSVPDVFSIRAGFIYDLKNVALSAGYREEGQPVHDLVGGSKGLRRPGHNISVEPGLIYKMQKVSLYAYVPIGVAHRINQTVPDEMISKITGKYTIGAGGSGIYQIFVGATFKL